ncbi:MASE1 domain-containing protein [Actinomyces culturomici]|uniref:MASE1 domain-containing protein n=1 Tax=Actinomyces culturomici TaxID=1926276 RepID=UPI000E20A2B1|nr:MASE1 domain-containing protein [Actinomyces culturomici]
MTEGRKTHGRALARTALFAIAFAVAVLAAQLFAVPGRELALVWPAAGIGVLWALTLRSRSEALGSAILVSSTFGAGFDAAASCAVAASNATVFLGSRAVLDLLHRRTPFVLVPERPPWAVRTAGQAALFVTAAFVASAAAVPLAYMALWGAPQPFDADDAVAHFFRNMAAIVLIAGTGAALLDSRIEPVRAPRWFTATAIAAPIVLGAIVFSPRLTIPLLSAMLIPLFWSAVRYPVWAAMLHTVYVDAVVLVLALVVNAAPIDVGLSRQGLATRIHLFVFVGATLSLVISAAVSRVRRQAESLAEAERAARQDADRLATVTRTVPDGLAIVHRDGRVEPLNDSSPRFLERDADGRVSLPTRISAADGSDLDGAERPRRSPSRDPRAATSPSPSTPPTGRDGSSTSAPTH